MSSDMMAPIPRREIKRGVYRQVTNTTKDRVRIPAAPSWRKQWLEAGATTVVNMNVIDNAKERDAGFAKLITDGKIKIGDMVQPIIPESKE